MMLTGLNQLLEGLQALSQVYVGFLFLPTPLLNERLYQDYMPLDIRAIAPCFGSVHMMSYRGMHVLLVNCVLTILARI